MAWAVDMARTDSHAARVFVRKRPEVRMRHRRRPLVPGRARARVTPPLPPPFLCSRSLLALAALGRRAARAPLGGGGWMAGWVAGGAVHLALLAARRHRAAAQGHRGVPAVRRVAGRVPRPLPRSDAGKAGRRRRVVVWSSYGRRRSSRVAASLVRVCVFETTTNDDKRRQTTNDKRQTTNDDKRRQTTTNDDRQTTDDDDERVWRTHTHTRQDRSIDLQRWSSRPPRPRPPRRC